MQIRKPVLIIEAGLLLAFFLATLYILFAKRDMPSSNRPPDAGSATAATAAAAPPAASAAAAPTVAPVPATAAEVLGRAPVAELAVQNPGAGVGGSVPLGSSCSFDATVYDVRLNPDQISRLDIDALTRDAATREGFEKALTALGTSRQIARANQAANFNQEQYVKLTNETPYVTGSTITATGQTENTVGIPKYRHHLRPDRPCRHRSQSRPWRDHPGYCDQVDRAAGGRHATDTDCEGPRFSHAGYTNAANDSPR